MRGSNFNPNPNPNPLSYANSQRDPQIDWPWTNSGIYSTQRMYFGTLLLLPTNYDVSLSLSLWWIWLGFWLTWGSHGVGLVNLDNAVSLSIYFFWWGARLIMDNGLFAYYVRLKFFTVSTYSNTSIATWLPPTTKFWALMQHHLMLINSASNH